MRTIGIIAHVDAGKTTLTERMLYLSGAVHKFGDVDNGTTVTDFGEQERERGITIQSAVVSMDWGGERICVVDTPGHEDFSGEVSRCMNAIDGAVVVMSGVEGVEPQTERAWRRAEGVPKIVFVNKMDRDGADGERVLKEIERAFCVTAVPMVVPVVDECRRMVEAEPAGFGAWVELLCLESDLAFREYEDSGDVSMDTARKELKRLCAEGRFVPVWFGSAKTGVGVKELMDGIVEFLPSPEESRERRIVSGSLKDGCFSGLVFKVAGGLHLMRVLTGSVKVGDAVTDTRSGVKMRIQKLVDVQGRRQTDVDGAKEGGIVGVCGLKGVQAGDALCIGCDAAYESSEVRKPLVSCVVEPRKTADKDALEEAMNSVCSEDGTLRWNPDERILSGLGALQLEVVLKRIADEYGVEVRQGECRAAKGLRLAKEGRVSTVCERSVGGKSARAEIECEWSDGGNGNMAWFGTDMPGRESLSCNLAHGLTDGMATGINGIPMVNESACVVKASWSGDVPPEGILYMAGAQCVEDAARELGVVEMEPVVKADLLIPNDCVGWITGWMSAHGGEIRGCNESDGIVKMSCVVGMSAMIEFGKILPSLTGGRGDMSMEPCGWRDR